MKIPKGELLRMPIRNVSSFSGNDKVSIFEEVARKKKSIPAPTKYALISVWSKGTNYGRPKGKFLTAKKISMTEQIARQSKDKLAPNKYNKVLQTWKSTVAPRLKGAMSLKSERIGYLDDAKWHSK